MLAPFIRHVHVEPDHDERQRGDRKVDEEEPPPRPVLSDESTRGRSDDRGQPKRRAHHSLVFAALARREDRKSTRLNSSHANISYAVFCLKKKKNTPLSRRKRRHQRRRENHT